MTELNLQGTADDGATLVLADANGEQYTLPIDDELFSAVRRDRARRAGGPAPGEPVRPRDIQALIRSGMTAEEVAEVTGADIEQVRTYEHPVLAERRHIAELAGRCLVYPQNGIDDSPRPLAELADERLELREVDLESISWDAWKAQTGAWHVELSFTAADSRRSAAWEFRRNSVRPLDDEARWLSDAGPTDSGPIPNFGSGTERVFNIEAENRRSASSGTNGQHGAHALHSPAAARGTGRDQAAETGRILDGLRRRRGRPEEAEGRREEPRSGLHSVADEPAARPDGAHTALSRPQDAADAGVFPFPAESTEPADDGNAYEAVFEQSPQSDYHDTQPIAPGMLFDDQVSDDQPSLLDEPGVSDEPAGDQRVTGSAADDASTAQSAEKARNAQPAQDADGAAKRRSGRASLPSWDEIMFGSKRD